MPNLRDLIRRWVENPDAPSLYIRPEREVLAEMVAEAVANTSYSRDPEIWGSRPTEPPVDGMAHGFTPLTAEEIAERDRQPSFVREDYFAYTPRHRNLSPSTVQHDSLQNGEPLANATCARCLIPDRQCVLRITDAVGLAPETREMVCLQCLGIGGYNSYVDLAGIRTDSTAPENTGSFVQDGREVGRIENLEMPPWDGRSHYRMFEGGACACGFTSIFSTTLDNHLQVANQPEGCMGSTYSEFSSTVWESAPVVNQADGVSRRWFTCSRCYDYGPCREYSVAAYNYIASFGAEPQLPPNSPEFRIEYRCDNCIGEGSGPTPPDTDPSPDLG